MRARLSLFLLIALSLPALSQLKPSVTLMQASSALLTDKNIQRHLKLDKNQIKLLETTFKWYGSQAGRIQKTNKDPKNAMRQIAVLQLQAADRLLAALSPMQKARLKQLGLQSYGPFSVLAPDVEKEIGLTSAQKKRLRAIQRQAVDSAAALVKERAAVANAVPWPKDQNDKAQRDAYVAKLREAMAKRSAADTKRAQAMKKQSDRKAFSVLTPIQRKKWDAMIGKKFPIPGRRA